jgi:hypothetical protein
MTSLDRLDSISKEGLTPRNEDNSKLINDQKVKVFFSEGFEGVVALYVDFDLVYQQIKSKELVLDNKELEEKILVSSNLNDYLKEGVYLEFDGDDIKNERNFENGCTSKIIPPEDLRVCVLSDEENTVTYSRFEIIKYMMSKTDPEDIKYYGVKYEGSPNFDAATQRIQGKIKNYYANHQEEINDFKKNNYQLNSIPLEEFMNDYYKVDSKQIKKR